jgi:hypothetical protein
MAVMAEDAKALRGSCSARSQLFELQIEQHHHDETYHREIARLSLHQRLNHMALHFAKYAGKIAVAEDSAALGAVCVDILIIALSTANIVNVALYDLLEKEERDFTGLLPLARSLTISMQSEIGDRHALLQETAIASGRMAAACEKIDHLEEIPFRAEIRHCIARLGGLALASLASNGVDPMQAVRERLTSVKKRLKLHGLV